MLFVIGTLDVGGTETQLVELVTRLDRRAFEPIVCSLAGGPLAARLRASGIAVHVLGFQGFRGVRFKYLFSAPAAWRMFSGLWRIIRRERPAILHGMLFWAYVLGTLVGRAAGVPIVISSRRSLGLFKAGKPVFLLLERIVNRQTDLFIANSEAVRADTIAREGIRPDRIMVIRNGLDLARFDGAPDASLAASLALSGAPRAIVVSNFIHYKGHEYFLRAWRDVLVRFPSAVAMLVGDGILRPDLERLVDDLGIRHAVRFLGVRQDVPKLLGLADLYVHPSLEEGYSNALLEAMASGKPIVATAVGGNVEALRDGETGLLVPSRNAGALAVAMLKLFEDPAAARRMGDSAAREVREHYDIGAMVRAYERIYTQLLVRARQQDHDAAAIVPPAHPARKED